MEFQFPKKTVSEQREYPVVKRNDLIQKSRYELSALENKVILYLMSKIKPSDEKFEEFSFQIMDFCGICGIHYPNSGGNYEYLKKILKDLSDRSFWVKMSDGSEVNCRWISKVRINKGSGLVKIRLDDDLKPYLLELKENFTAYEIKYTLVMKSQYSIRLYELLKSHEYRKKNIILDLDSLKQWLCAEHYSLYADFRRKVLDIALREINGFSDIIISFRPVTMGRKYVGIEFSIKLKETSERLGTWANIEKVLGDGKEVERRRRGRPPKAKAPTLDSKLEPELEGQIHLNEVRDD